MSELCCRALLSMVIILAVLSLSIWYIQHSQWYYWYFCVNMIYIYMYVDTRLLIWNKWWFSIEDFYKDLHSHKNGTEMLFGKGPIKFPLGFALELDLRTIFTNDFRCAISNPMEMIFRFIQFLIFWLQQNFAHAMAAVLSWHEQQFVAITPV